jgi:hypothetical protein
MQAGMCGMRYADIHAGKYAGSNAGMYRDRYKKVILAGMQAGGTGSMHAGMQADMKEVGW